VGGQRHSPCQDVGFGHCHPNPRRVVGQAADPRAEPRVGCLLLAPRLAEPLEKEKGERGEGGEREVAKD
jgi:hypothetical protein